MFCVVRLNVSEVGGTTSSRVPHSAAPIWNDLSVREALNRPASLGLVDARPNQGCAHPRPACSPFCAHWSTRAISSGKRPPIASGCEARISLKKFSGRTSWGVLARGLMMKLSRDLGETVVLARADDRRKCIACTDVVEGAASVRYAVAVGTTRPYYASAAGRVVLAHKDDSWVSNYLDNTSLHSITAQTVTSRSRLLETLKDVRRSGVSLSVEEATDGGAGIAAPILASDGKLLDVLSIGAIASRARRDSEKYGNAVKQAAAEISVLLGALTKIS